MSWSAGAMVKLPLVGKIGAEMTGQKLTKKSPEARLSLTKEPEFVECRACKARPFCSLHGKCQVHRRLPTV